MSTKPRVAPEASPKRDADVCADSETVFVDRYIDGILDPAGPMLGPVRDGGHIVANTAPGCWAR